MGKAAAGSTLVLDFVDMKLIKNPMLRRATFVVGVVFVVFGTVGIFVPLWPTTPFLLAAGWCFFRSSPKAYFWLRSRPHLGKAIDDWERKGAIATSAKLFALSTLLGSLVIIWWIVPFLWIQMSVTVLFSIVSTFILTRPAP